MDKKKHSVFTLILSVLGIVSLLGILYRSYPAYKQMGESYRALTEYESQEKFDATIYYDDGLYAVLGFGMEVHPGEAGNVQRTENFIASAFASIYERIFAADVLYTMMVTAFMALLCYERGKEDHARQTLSIIVCVIAVYLIFVLADFVFSKIARIPFVLPSGTSVMMLGVSLLSVIGGHCAFGLLLRKIPFKNVVSVFAIPVIIALFLLGTVLSGQLYTDPEIESFDYVAEQTGDAYGNAYYDDVKNVMVVDGREYKPELVENPDHLKGIAWIAAFVFEVLNPYSGNSLEMIRQIIEKTPALWAVLFYSVKALCWIVLSLTRRG